MQRKVIENPLLHEKYVDITHDTGLRILILPKSDYTTSYATFGTRYGSIDTHFKRSDESEWTTVPEGIAHFLEHKLFESEEQDAFTRYAKTGASANAFTSFDKTCYLFSCTDHFMDSLEILLDFVQNPYFTPATVQKEQGIIGQEIRMYDDAAGWRVFFNLLKGLYASHPVRIDIAGTVESIAQIDAPLLYRCYHTFYHLSNMALCIAGNVSEEAILALCDKMLKPAAPLSIERTFPPEPPAPVESYVEQKLAVASSLFALGYKESSEPSEPTLRDKLESAILLEVLAGEASDLYRTLMDEGLINASFGTEYFYGHGYRCLIFQGESSDPQRVTERIRAEIARLRQGGIAHADFERARKLLYGRSIMTYNDVESIANALITSSFLGYGLFDETTLYAEITHEDIEKRFAGLLYPERSCLSVVKPV